MVIYEITAIVEHDLCEAYESFMRDRHIPDLMATSHFTGASFDRSGDGRYRTRYEAPTRAALDQYLLKDAPRLRTDFSKHFPTGVELTREEWTVMERFA